MPPIGALCRLNLHFRYPGTHFHYLWHHFQQTLPVVDFYEWANEVMDAWNATCAEPYFRQKSAEYEAVDMSMTQVFPVSDVEAIGAFTTYTHGNRSVGGGPGQCAGRILWRTGLPGRSYRGKSLISGWAYDQLGSDSLGVLAWGALRDYAQAMLNAFGPAGTVNRAQLVVVSRQLDNVPREDPVGTPIIAYEAAFDVHTVRKRARRG